MKQIDGYNLRNLVIDYFDRILMDEKLSFTECKTIEIIKADIQNIFNERLK